MELLITANFQSHFKITLGIRTVKPTGEISFPKMDRNCQHFDSLLDLDVAADCVTNCHSGRIDFYCNHEEIDAKVLAYIKFPCDNILLNRVIIASPGTDVAVISIPKCLTSLDAIWSKTGTVDDN